MPTDGSDPSTAAVDQSLAIAASEEATVHFLHVIDVGTEMAASGVGTIADELTKTLEQEATDALDSAVAKAEEAGVEYEQILVEGVPHDVIVEYSAEHDVDLIAMGASGRSGLKEHLLGSTTDRVVRSVERTVLLAPS